MKERLSVMRGRKVVDIDFAVTNTILAGTQRALGRPDKQRHK